MASAILPPTGTLAFVFTDIEGSTAKWEIDPDGMSVALRRHNELISREFDKHSGLIFKSTGDGFCVAFERPDAAILACLDAQRALAEEDWSVAGGMRVRMSVHVGSANRIENDFIGPTLNRAARILDLGHGGQVLISSTCHALVQDTLPGEIRLESLGNVELEGLLRPEEVFQVRWPELRARFPALRTRKPPREARRHNFQAEPRPFVGREQEKAELAARLESEAERLITVTGIGGIGKSRLAKEVAAEAAHHFPDGAWLIDCSSLQTREQIAASAVMTLGADPDESGPEAALAHWLSNRCLLLVLDCFESLVDQAGWIDDLLRSAPQLKILVTSRTVLGSEWEYEFPLGPLSLARKEHGAADGVALFEDAARHVHGSFRIGRKNRAAVASIVRALEGVPLAIVLAAGRLRHLTLTELRDQVQTRKLEVLKRKPVGNDRHANLLEVIEGSFVLLSHEDRRLAIALSVFEGGFALDDALPILGDWIAPLDGISRLRDHSLLVASASGPHMRYRALDTVREYLAGAVEDFDLVQVQRAHARHFSLKAREVRSLFEAGQWQAASSMLWTDAGNFRAATRYALTHGEPGLIKTFAASLARAYLEAGVTTEFETLIRAAEQAAGLEDDYLFKAEILGLRGEFERRKARLAGAKKLWQSRMDLGRLHGDPELEVDALIDLADMAIHEHAYDAASKLAERFDELEPFVAKTYLRACGYVLKAKLAMNTQHTQDALEFARTALRLTDGVVPDTSCFFIGANIASIFRRAERYDEAKTLNLKLLANALENNWPHFAVKMLFELSEIYVCSGNVEDAARVLTLASMVPRSQSLSLREEAKRRTLAFETEFGSNVIQIAAAWAKGRNWVSIATEVAEGSAA